MEIARAEKDYDKMDLIGKAIQALEDDIKLHKVRLIINLALSSIPLFLHTIVPSFFHSITPSLLSSCLSDFSLH
jgi:hypothetical protein